MSKVQQIPLPLINFEQDGRFVDDGFVLMPIHKITDSTQQALLPFCTAGSGTNNFVKDDYKSECFSCCLCKLFC